MKTLNRYIGREVLYATLLVFVALLMLFALFELIHELGNVGKDGYTLGRALLFVALSLPGHVYELMPTAALIGTLFAIAQLVQVIAAVNDTRIQKRRRFAAGRTHHGNRTGVCALVRITSGVRAQMRAGLAHPVCPAPNPSVIPTEPVDPRSGSTGEWRDLLFFAYAYRTIWSRGTRTKKSRGRFPVPGSLTVPRGLRKTIVPGQSPRRRRREPGGT